MTDLFPPAEFDTWAANYDQSTRSNTGYPFEGYAELLKTIVDLCQPRPGAAVLDLGIGTGNLSLPFARLGCEIWGLDFSAKMLALAQAKLPTATLAQVDLRLKWPPLFQRRFDCIISAYTFHHLSLNEKVGLIQRLIAEYLSPGGTIVIGDIAFRDAAEEDELCRSLGSEWDEEYYWLADETQDVFSNVAIAVTFIKISSCAGIFQFFPQ